jgi:hypothetical protein
MLKRALLTLLLAAIPLQATALENEDVLALVAMPLAVAAVSEVTDVPMSELMNVVSLLNDADVPPAQFVEVVRYVPVAFVAESEPAFHDFVRVRYEDGMRGEALVNEIESRYETYGLSGVDLTVTEPRLFVDEQPIIPAIVTTRVAAARQHPHGGPPGQLKKERGVQTGAEIVHAATPRINEESDRDRVAERRPRKVKADKVDKVKIAKGKSPKAKVAKAGKHERRAIARGNGKGEGNGKGHGGGNGKGKGKGK